MFSVNSLPSILPSVETSYVTLYTIFAGIWCLFTLAMIFVSCNHIDDQSQLDSGTEPTSALSNLCLRPVFIAVINLDGKTHNPEEVH